MTERNALRINSKVSIPWDELHFSFTRSSGPGGQHANKAATQVELAFDVANSPSLNKTQRKRVRRELRSHINKEGVLRLTCQSTRSQHRNREEAIERFQELMRGALRRRKRRKRTRPTKASKERRLQEKKRRGRRKKQRRFRPEEGY
jgi:ribosome-associated protein